MKINIFKYEFRNFLIWFFLYFIAVIVGQLLSHLIFQDSNSLMLVIGIVLTAILLKKLGEEDALSYYGFDKLSNLNNKKLLYYIPFVLLVAVNFISGIHINDTLINIILEILVCFIVGFWEEILFRSFLVRTIQCKCNNDRQAIIVSSVLFGCMHLFNLFGDADLLATILQVFYATSFGFMASVFFIKTKNIIPVMICHACVNITDVFMAENLSSCIQYIGAVAMIVITSGYGFYLMKSYNDN